MTTSSLTARLGGALALALIATSPAAAGDMKHMKRETASKPAAGDIVDVAAKAGSFKTLIAAAKAAGLVPALKGKGPITVFAPTDAAFAKLPKGTVAMLLKPENKAKLQAILKYHVVAGRVPAAAIIKAGTADAKTLHGKTVRAMYDKKAGAVFVDRARVIKADVPATNGVIHVIDRVLMPN
jgi:uncharacterized surface protein with fasciclin (FAS1) repeats